TALAMSRLGVPFLLTLPAAFLIPAILGVALERTLYRRLYGASPLDQVLFTIGLVLMAMPVADVLVGHGAQLRAAVDDARVAQGLGVDVDRIFAVAFAVGSGLAGLGGALAADVVGGVDPSFPVKFLVTFL